MSSFGLRLRQLRKGNKLTQTQLANALGLAFSTISMYERGVREPDFETLEAIADYFNVTMDYLHGKDSSVEKKGITQNELSLSPEQRALLTAVLDLSVDDSKKALEYVELLKLKHNS